MLCWSSRNIPGNTPSGLLFEFRVYAFNSEKAKLTLIWGAAAKLTLSKGGACTVDDGSRCILIGCTERMTGVLYDMQIEERSEQKSNGEKESENRRVAAAVKQDDNAGREMKSADLA